MWIMMNNGMFSIVEYTPDNKYLLVRARKEGHIEEVFTKVNKGDIKFATGTDYAYRAVVKRGYVTGVIAKNVSEIDYGNFKSSVKDKTLANAYMGVWQEMWDYQQKENPLPVKSYGYYDNNRYADWWRGRGYSDEEMSESVSLQEPTYESRENQLDVEFDLAGLSLDDLYLLEDMVKREVKDAEHDAINGLVDFDN